MTDDPNTPYVRPDVAAFLAYLNAMPSPKLHEVTPEAARAMTRAMGPVADLPVGEIAVLRDLSLPGPAGREIALRLFDPRPARDPGPVVVFYHGGGWTIGDLDSYSPVCAEIARVLDLPVVSVDYALAPEHPWPAGPDDAEAAARWVAEAPAALGLSPTSLVLAGDSAGGNLAIIVAAALRDAPAAVPVIAQWPIYPATDLVTRYDSFRQFRDGHLLTQDAMRWFFEHYQAEMDHPRASPLLHGVAGLPPAVVTTASLDPIRDQGRAYAAALADAGVPVSLREAKGNIHGFISLRKAIPSSSADLAGDIAALKALIEEVTQ